MKKILLIIFIPLLFSCECKKITIKCTILSHNTSSDKCGCITYNTIIKREDGLFQNTIGMNFYVKQIGETTYITETSCK